MTPLVDQLHPHDQAPSCTHRLFIFAVVLTFAFTSVTHLNQLQSLQSPQIPKMLHLAPQQAPQQASATLLSLNTSTKSGRHRGWPQRPNRGTRHSLKSNQFQQIFQTLIVANDKRIQKLAPRDKNHLRKQKADKQCTKTSKRRFQKVFRSLFKLA